METPTTAEILTQELTDLEQRLKEANKLPEPIRTKEIENLKHRIESIKQTLDLHIMTITTVGEKSF